MKILWVFTFLLLLGSPLYAAEAKHYDKLKIFARGEFKKTTYYNGMVSTNTVRTNFKGIGPQLTSSRLTSSTARIIKCPDPVNDMVLKSVEEYSRKHHEPNFMGLKIKECIEIDYRQAKVYFVEFAYRVALDNADYESEGEIPIIWVGLEDRKGLKEVRLMYSFPGIRGDSALNADLAGVADVNRDGRHEIVINAVLYAGRYYLVLGFEHGAWVEHHVDGDSWD